MALEKSITSPHGILCPNAYHKVQASTLYKPAANSGGFVYKVQNAVAVFYDSTARENNNQPVFEYWFDVEETDCSSYYSFDNLDGTNQNQFSQTYDYMKTQSDLAGIDYTDSTDA